MMKQLENYQETLFDALDLYALNLLKYNFYCELTEAEKMKPFHACL